MAIDKIELFFLDQKISIFINRGLERELSRGLFGGLLRGDQSLSRDFRGDFHIAVTG